MRVFFLIECLTPNFLVKLSRRYCIIGLQKNSRVVFLLVIIGIRLNKSFVLVVLFASEDTVVVLLAREHQVEWCLSSIRYRGWVGVVFQQQFGTIEMPIGRSTV